MFNCGKKKHKLKRKKASQYVKYVHVSILPCLFARAFIQWVQEHIEKSMFSEFLKLSALISKDGKGKLFYLSE